MKRHYNYSDKQKASRPETRLERGEYLTRAREYCLRGMDLPQTKLPEKAVEMIRAAAAKREELRREITDRYSNAALARFWGVHVRTIEKIVSRESWGHVK